jgi:hypothetical protein
LSGGLLTREAVSGDKKESQRKGKAKRKKTTVTKAAAGADEVIE